MEARAWVKLEVAVAPGTGWRAPFNRSARRQAELVPNLGKNLSLSVTDPKKQSMVA